MPVEIVMPNVSVAALFTGLEFCKYCLQGWNKINIYLLFSVYSHELLEWLDILNIEQIQLEI